MKARYVNPFTDFGFKKLFGEEASKPQLIDFLSNLLPQLQIVDLSFGNLERHGRTAEDRKAVYDIFCDIVGGEKVIVELQKAKQTYFKDRTLYYSTFPIQQQAEKGNWNYKLSSIYCVGILDFTFEDKRNKADSFNEVIHVIQLKDQNNQLFYDKLKFVYLEMPHFLKKENELVTGLDKWLYFIKNLENFEAIPEIFKEQVFVDALEKAKIANYSQEELIEYEDSLKTFRDYKATIDTAFDAGKAEGKVEGKVEGKAEGKIEVVRSAKKMGLSMAEIMFLTGFGEAEIEEIKINEK